MSNKEKIFFLLQEIKELEDSIKNIQDAELYPVSFFSKAYDLTHTILNHIHALEFEQVELLKKQMEEHQRFLNSIPASEIIPQPVIADIPVVEKEPPVILEEIKEEVIIEESIEEKEELISIQTEDIPNVPPPPPMAESIPEEPIVKEENRVSTTTISEKTVVSLSEILEKKALADFKKAFSLNDRFYFLRELFGGDENKMNETISTLNEMDSYEKSLNYLVEEKNWDLESLVVMDFLKLLEKRFL